MTLGCAIWVILGAMERVLRDSGAQPPALAVHKSDANAQRSKIHSCHYSHKPLALLLVRRNPADPLAQPVATAHASKCPIRGTGLRLHEQFREPWKNSLRRGARIRFRRYSGAVSACPESPQRLLPQMSPADHP